MSNKNFDEIFKSLLSYQVPHALQLYESFFKNNCVLDASDTGTGKTYTTIALCKMLGLRPFVICPKSVINNWIDVCEKMNVKILGISNYEKLKASKYYTENLESVVCPYMDKITTNKKDDFVFQLPSDTLLIFDEAHRCKNHKSVTSRLLISARDCNNKIILLSATITDKLDTFRPFGVVFSFYDDVKKFKIWIRRKLKLKQMGNELEKGGKKPSDNDTMLQIIHDELFPSRGSRLRISELGSLFPSNQVIAKCYYSDDHEEVDKLYNIINEALESLSKSEKKSDGLAKITYARMRIEMFKTPIIIDLVEDALESNFSVAIFVNFKDTMNYLAYHLQCDCLIHGEQTLEERQFSIDQFQNNKSKIIICNIRAGGVGISLHDIHGGHPRISLISPSWTGTDVVQALGRIHRAGSKSAALQRIIYIAKSYEEQICKTLSTKLATLNAINDGDMTGLLDDIITEKIKIVDDPNTKHNNDENIDDLNPKKIDGKKNALKRPPKKKYITIINDEPDDLSKKNVKDGDALEEKAAVGQLDKKYRTKK